MILHHSGKYILDNFGDDDWANLNHVARLVGAPLAELSVEPAGQNELFPYVYHGARIRCVLAVTPKPPTRDAQGNPLSSVLFVDSRPVGFDVNFMCLGQGFVLREQLLRHLQQPPPLGWHLVARGGQRRGLGFDFVHGEVLTLAFARQAAACDGNLEEQPESEHDFSPDEEEPFDGSSEDRRARTRTRSRTPGRGASPAAGQDASSDHSYHGLEDKAHDDITIPVKDCVSEASAVATKGTILCVSLHAIPSLSFRGPSYAPRHIPLGGHADTNGRPTLPALRDIGDRSPERPNMPTYAVDPPMVLPAQPVIILRGLFVVLAEGYRPEVIPLDLRLPVDIASARAEIQSVRLPLCKHRFPYLIPMPYQPCGQFAIFLAAPAWTKDEIEIAFDCRGIGGMVHTKCVPMLMSVQQLREAAGVASWLQVEAWVEPFRSPASPQQILRLYPGSLVVFQAAGAGSPRLHDLTDMLRSVAGWDQLVDLPFSFDPSAWILTDDGPFRHLVETAQGGLRRQDIAQMLGYDPARLILVPPEPPVRDFNHVGLCTSAALVVSQTVPNLRGPRFGPCVVFLDQRPILSDLTWMVCPDGLFHLSAYVETVPRRCPPGFQVSVWEASPIAGTDQYRVADGTRLTITFELTQPNPMSMQPADAPSESESSDARHTLMSDSDSDSGSSSDADDSVQDPPAGPPPPRPFQHKACAVRYLHAYMFLQCLLTVQPVAAVQDSHACDHAAQVSGCVMLGQRCMHTLLMLRIAAWLPSWFAALCHHAYRLLREPVCSGVAASALTKLCVRPLDSLPYPGPSPQSTPLCHLCRMRRSQTAHRTVPQCALALLFSSQSTHQNGLWSS